MSEQTESKPAPAPQAQSVAAHVDAIVVEAVAGPPQTPQAKLVKELVDAGVHFGHRVSRWNPKMEAYIRGKRNMIHIIDIKETIKGLYRARKLVQNLVAGGKAFLF